MTVVATDAVTVPGAPTLQLHQRKDRQLTDPTAYVNRIPPTCMLHSPKGSQTP